MSFAVRADALAEVMDGPCDERRLFATYRHFALANRVVSGWRRIYATRLRPLLREQAGADAAPLRLLDVGFGGGDIPRALAAWAAADRLPLAVTAIDPDERALDFINTVGGRPRGGQDSQVRYLAVDTAGLRATGERFDVVVSNHVLHHLDAAALTSALDDSAALATRLVLHDDIERSRLAYAAWAVGALPFAADSYAWVDGLRSIRRSYTAAELAAAAPVGWRVDRAFPWRLLLVHDAVAAQPAAADRRAGAQAS